MALVDEEELIKSLDSGKVKYYVTDFPIDEKKNHDRVIALPHLGASTSEAEDNCAMMIAKQIKDYLENGNIVNSVNFPDAKMPRAGEEASCYYSSKYSKYGSSNHKSYSRRRGKYC